MRGPGGRMACEDLGVAERNAGVEGVGDRRMTQRVWADVTGDPGSLRGPRDHPVGIAAVDRPARHRAPGSAHRWSVPPEASRMRRTGTVSGMVAGLSPLPTRCRTR